MRNLDTTGLKDFFATEHIDYVSLVDSNKKSIVPFSKKKENIKAQVGKIVQKLEGSLHSNGVYYLLIKDNYSDVTPKIIRINKGDEAKSIEVVETIKESPTMSENVLGYKEVLELQTKLNRLEIENEILKEALEEQELEESAGLSEAASNKWIELAEKIALPLLEKHFEQKERELAILEKTGGLSKGTAPLPTAAPRPVSYSQPVRATTTTRPMETVTQVINQVTAPAAATTSWDDLEGSSNISRDEQVGLDFLRNASAEQIRALIQTAINEQDQDAVNQLLKTILDVRQDGASLVLGY